MQIIVLIPHGVRICWYIQLLAESVFFFCRVEMPESVLNLKIASQMFHSTREVLRAEKKHGNQTFILKVSVKIERNKLFWENKLLKTFQFLSFFQFSVRICNRFVINLLLLFNFEIYHSLSSIIVLIIFFKDNYIKFLLDYFCAKVSEDSLNFTNIFASIHA
jgi:hypothetical protein